MRNPPLRMQHGTMLGMHEPGVVGVRKGGKKNDGWCTYFGLFGMFGWKVEFEIPPERLITSASFLLLRFLVFILYL
jgi:hypothetical protein